MLKRIARQFVYWCGLRPATWHPDLKYGIRARWWFRMEEVNRTAVLGPLTISPFRIVR